jgi:hypothetical protein
VKPDLGTTEHEVRLAARFCKILKIIMRRRTSQLLHARVRFCFHFKYSQIEVAMPLFFVDQGTSKAAQA